jgi:hypothetical protein
MKFPTVLFLIALALPAAAQPRPNLRLIITEDDRPALGGSGDSHARSPRLDRRSQETLEFIRESRACLQPARIADWSPTPDPWRLESGPERIPQCMEGDQ